MSIFLFLKLLSASVYASESRFINMILSSFKNGGLYKPITDSDSELKFKLSILGNLYFIFYRRKITKP